MRQLLVLFVLFATGCKQEYDVTGLAGQDGALRFNLTFTNQDAVDLDLHVVTPAGDEVYYLTPSDASGGALDVDCYCSSCADGPNENIFWAYQGGAPAGAYQVSVHYYIACSGYDYGYYDTGATDTPGAASDYTLRFLVGGEVVETHAGTLDTQDQTDSYTYTYAP